MIRRTEQFSLNKVDDLVCLTLGLDLMLDCFTVGFKLHQFIMSYLVSTPKAIEALVYGTSE